MRRPLLWFLVCAVVGSTYLSTAAEIRTGDVLYLDEFGEPPLKLKVLRRVAITLSSDPRTVIGYLAAGQTLTVTGVGKTHHYGEGRIATGPVRGWVRADALELPAQAVVERLEAARARRLAHKELIARNEVALGMTLNEVHASLGKPDRKKRVRSDAGEVEQWLYFKYRYVPHYRYQHDAEGKLRPVVSYRRVPSGHRAVTFREGAVVEIADDLEVNPDAAPETIVPFPGQ
jgi:hypothetical protein